MMAKTRLNTQLSAEASSGERPYPLFNRKKWMTPIVTHTAI
jgi:hypothetical protein